MTTPSIRAYMTVLRVHAKRLDWAASLAVFREMRERGVKRDSLVLNFVLATGVSADQVEEAASLVEEVHQDSPSILDVVSYNTVVKSFAKSASKEYVPEVLALLAEVGGSCDPSLLSSLYATVLEAASPDEALLAEALSQMRAQ